MKKIYQLTLAITLLLTSASVWAQSQVSGVVADGAGAPLIGASVVEEGTTNGVSTDAQGRYTIRTQSEEAVLTFSYIGYAPARQEVAGRTTIDIRLEEEANVFDDVVVVGYGTQKKVNVTGAVTSIDFDKQMQGRPILSTSSALAGLAPGMNVSQGSGQPGSDGATIRLRGTGSFTSSSCSPLVLVDGIEWSMNDINPNDIATISVLKDAASTAIYGTRAANGVILITTRQGRADRMRISYSYSGIVQMPYNDLEFVSDYARYMNLVNEACDNMNTTRLFSQSSIEAWEAAKADPHGLNAAGVPNCVAYPNTDWFSEIFHTGYSQEHNLQVSGGSKKISYLVSMGYLDNQGIMNRWNLDSSTQKINFRTNLEAKVTDWFTVGTRILAQKQDYGMANISNGFRYLYQTTPGVYPGEPNYWGRPALSAEESSNANNIFGQMAGGTGYNTTQRLNGSIYARLRLYRGLSVEGTFNYSPVITERSSYSRPNGYWDYVTDTRNSESALANATITNSTSRSDRLSTELLARYEGAFGDHSIGVLAGYSALEYDTRGWSVSRKGATDWTLHDLGTYAELTSSSNTPAAGWGLRSYFGRVNYSYKERYLFEANLRADGSSRFGENNRYGIFPSFSAGWRISEEPWMEPARDWLSSLKLRASWGQPGNHQGIGKYASQPTYAPGKVVVAASPTPALYIASLSNANLQWETTVTTDIGLDFGLFDNRLTGEVDFYDKKTTDILYTPSIYLTMGLVSGVPENCGEVRNRGVELSLKWNSSAGKDFHYYVGVNFSYNANKVTEFKGALRKYWDDGVYRNNLTDVSDAWGAGRLCEGRMLGETYMRRVYRGSGEGYTGGAVDIHAGPRDGMIRTPADLQWVQAMIDSGYSFNGVTTIAKDQLWYGDLLYADRNGDGNYGDDNDQDFTGHSALPRYNVGLNLGFSYKNFDFSMLWAGALGFHLNWSTDYYNSTLVSHGYGIVSHIADNHYFFDPQNEADARTNVGGKYPRLTYGTTLNNRLSSDFYEYRGDYLKLKNVQIGYTLPERWTRKFLVSKLRAYVSMENLLTITSYPGLDPEIGTAIGYPLMRQISFGAQITF